jgi:hypothetical protein
MLGISQNGMPVTVNVLFSKMPCKISHSVKCTKKILEVFPSFYNVFVSLGLDL